MAKETFDRSKSNTFKSTIGSRIAPTQLTDVSSVGMTNSTMTGTKIDILKVE